MQDMQRQHKKMRPCRTLKRYEAGEFRCERNLRPAVLIILHLT